MIIREAKEIDQDCILRLVEDVQKDLNYGDLMDNFLNVYSIDRCIVAEPINDNKGPLIGISTWGKIRRNFLVSHWNIIHPDYQQKGYGSKLVLAKYNKFTSMPIDCFYIDTPHKFWMDWHERYGFIKWSRISFKTKNQFGDLGYYQRMKKIL